MTDNYSLRSTIEKDLIRVIKSLPPEKLLDLYKSLSGIKVEDKGNIEVPLGIKKDIKDITKEYSTHLRSQNKADSTIIDYLGAAGKLILYMGKNKIEFESLTMSDIDNYLSFIRSRNISNNTYVKILNCVRSFLHFLYGRNYMDKDLASFIKVPPKIKPIKEELSDLDIKKIRNYLSVRKEKYRNENLRDEIIFSLGIDCGLRRQEFINLNWEDINFKENSISIKNSKGRKNRVVYFNSNLGKLMHSYRKLSGKYINALIRGTHGKRITKCSLQNIISRIFKESKTYRKNLTLHSLSYPNLNKIQTF
jgi:site-specific recombinase XerD